MRISDWSSDVCSSDLQLHGAARHLEDLAARLQLRVALHQGDHRRDVAGQALRQALGHGVVVAVVEHPGGDHLQEDQRRSEEHTSELQSLMRISYAVFCLKKKQTQIPSYTILRLARHNL